VCLLKGLSHTWEILLISRVVFWGRDHSDIILVSDFRVISAPKFHSVDFSCERPKMSEKIEWDREYPPSITNGLLALVFLSQKAFSLLIIVLFFCSKSFFHQRSLISLSDLIQLNFLLACLTKSICLPYHLHKSWLWLNFVWIVW